MIKPSERHGSSGSCIIIIVKLNTNLWNLYNLVIISNVSIKSIFMLMWMITSTIQLWYMAQFHKAVLRKTELFKKKKPIVLIYDVSFHCGLLPDI